VVPSPERQEKNMTGEAVVIRGDARHLPLPDASVDLVVTSPPYFGLRSYTDGGAHYEGQIGSEETPAAYVAALVDCTREWIRVLKPTGSLFINLGDKYAQTTERNRNGISSPLAGSTHRVRILPLDSVCTSGPLNNGGVAVKSLMGLPWRYALACTDQLGLTLRAEIIWAKPNGLPESVTDRVRRAHEQVFHFTVQPRYYAAVDEIREPHIGIHGGGSKYIHAAPEMRSHTQLATTDGHPLGKLPGSVWTIPSAPLTVPPNLGIDHYAAFPPALVRPLVLGWSPPGICTGCGEGRRPVVDRERILLRPGDMPGRAALNGDAVHGFDRRAGTHQLSRNTITGYACACPTPDAPTRPSVILDPFGGTGTTALVAAVHGRTGITIDRSADYSRLAAWRTTDPAERARALDVPKPPPVPDGMEPLFTM
jgi:DNA modification methylase